MEGRTERRKLYTPRHTSYAGGIIINQIYFCTTVVNEMTTGCLKKRGPFFKLVQFIYFSRNLSKILYGHNKMILICSEEESIYSSTSARSDVIMMSDCIYDNIVLFICTIKNTNGIK